MRQICRAARAKHAEKDWKRVLILDVGDGQERERERDE